MKKALFVLVILLAIGTTVAYILYSRLLAPNIKAEAPKELYVTEGMTYGELKSKLETEYLTSTALFHLSSKLMKYQAATPKPGRYLTGPNMSSVDLIRKLRAGDQAATKVVINSVRTLPELAGKITENLAIDSLDFSRALEDEELMNELDVTAETYMSLFIPNSYEVYWTTSARDLIRRMAKESQRFWSTGQRKDNLESIGLTRTEAYILASIVEKESPFNSEKPRIAGLYLNRLRINMPLQADPTVIFGLQDFSIRRVLNKHLEYDSPYNTYKYPGLPVGPICMPNMSSIEAVLNPESHDYLYFCAKPDLSGHRFAKTLRQHNIYAAEYRRSL